LASTLFCNRKRKYFALVQSGVLCHHGYVFNDEIAMKKPETDVDIKMELRVHIARNYKTQTAAAKAWGCTPAYVSGVLKGKKNPNQRMLDDAGFERVQSVKYVRKPAAKA
jgi:hypothetical protein